MQEWEVEWGMGMACLAEQMLIEAFNDKEKRIYISLQDYLQMSPEL